MSDFDKKLKKILNPNKARFILFFYDNENKIDEMKEIVKALHPNAIHKTLELAENEYSDVSEHLYSEKSSFVFVDDFGEILDSEKFYAGFNLHRDKFQQFPVNLICFAPIHQKDDIFVRASWLMGDFWDFRFAVLEI